MAQRLSFSEVAMSYRSITVPLTTEQAATAALLGAFSVAQSCDGHVSGVHVMQDLTTNAAVDVHVPASFFDEQRKVAREQASHLKSLFEAQAARYEVPWDWQCDGAFHLDVARKLSLECRATDLVVIGHTPSDDLPISTDLVSTLAFESGRPVLAVPNSWGDREIGKRTVIAWNGSREAAEAVFDALPLLTMASDVRIVVIDPDGIVNGRGFSPAEQLGRVLSRHEVEAEVTTVSSSGSGIPGAIAEQLRASNADLLVMGCYGHSRLREFWLGGTTRSVLTHMTVPTLMSH
jgi:nucleotide-binding universal stress UspA family protein